MNLFFVHTPFQVLVAQNLIIEKELEGNIIALSNTGREAEYFYDLFDNMLIDKLWNGKEISGNLNNGIFTFSKPFASYIKLRIFSGKIRKLIRDKKVSALYFGDINHPAYIFLAEKWSNNKKIYFFEEGISNYTVPLLKKKFDRSLFVTLKSFVVDKIIYGPLGVDCFSKYTLAVKDAKFEFNIQKKYNLLPVKENAYDEIVRFNIYLSDKLKLILAQQNLPLTKNIDQPIVVYLSTSATSFLVNPIEDEMKVLKEISRGLNRNCKFLIKFHPKDTEEKKSAIKNGLTNDNIDYQEISSSFSYPVEILFKYIPVDYLFGYGSSAQLYFEIYYPGIPNYNLFNNLRKIYLNEEVNNDYPLTNVKLWETIYEKYFKKKPAEFV